MLNGQRIRTLSLLVVLWSAFTAKSVVASVDDPFEECTVVQWTECWCAADEDCIAANGQPPQGECWVGDVETCDATTGNCTGGCYLVHEDFCRPQPCGPPGE